jgi:hypothetical protein
MEEQLIEIIQLQKRHSNYDRTIAIRKFCHMIATGENQDDVVENFRRFETDSQKEQRKRLYVPMTPYAISRPRKYFKKLLRLEGVRTTINSESESRVEQVKEMFQAFMPGETLDMWLLRNIEYLGVVDPNAYIVFERYDKRDEFGEILNTKVYPVIFGSEQVVWKQEMYGELTVLTGRIMELEVVYSSGTIKEQILSTYYHYTPGQVVRAREVGEKTIKEDGEQEVMIDIVGTGNRLFLFRTFQNGTTEVPGMCVGAYFDEEKNTGSFVSWFYPAKHLFLDLIRTKSSKDLTMALHTYKKRWQFVKECKFSDDKGNRCEGGYLGGTRLKAHMCPSCEGTGKEATFTTEQEAIELTLPSHKDQMLDLSKLAYVENVDINLPEFQSKEIQELVAAIMACIFDTGLYQKPTDSKTRTATEINAVVDGVNDVLQPFCDLFSRMYELAYRVAFQYYEIPATIDHSFPEDKVIQTLLELLQEMQELQKSGADYETIERKRSQVYKKVAEGDPVTIKKLEIKSKWMPFADKTQEVANAIVSNRAANDPDRVLFENFVEAFRIVDEKYPDFYNSTYEAQRGIMADVIAEISQRIQPETVLTIE